MEKLTLGSRFRQAWNAFFNKDPTIMMSSGFLGYGNSWRPDRVSLSRGNERSIVTSVYNRISLDVAAMNIYHVQLDDTERFSEKIQSNLNKCLTLEANIDQTGRALIHDVVMSLLDEGQVAIVPTDVEYEGTSSYDILTLRVGKILEWYPKHIKLRVYNQDRGIKEDIILPKESVAIVENPLYAIMNEPNSTLQRLIRKLNLLDYVDEQSGSGKLDMIIQLPYTIKSQVRKEQAESRKRDIEEQLYNSKYGIAYVDATEKITQLNRPVDNNLMKQIEYLTSMLFSQLGITQSILDGTADEKTMINYYNRTVEPIISAIVDEMRRKFLNTVARERNQSIMFFKNPFNLVPISDLASMADSFTRNEIMTSNEVRQIIGMKPSNDPGADELRNKNLSQPNDGGQTTEIQNEENYNEEV